MEQTWLQKVPKQLMLYKMKGDVRDLTFFKRKKQAQGDTTY